MLIARAGDGSMRDAQSAFDQVIAFAGTTIAAEDVSTVLGLVRRDLLIDMADAVAREDAAAVFALTDRAVEGGYELRTVLRELGRLARDLLVVRLDASRLDDPEIAAEGERDRLKAVAAQFSAEDLLRAFDVLTKGELEIKTSMQPRFHLEMTLLRWIHLRKLVPLSDLIDGMERGGGAARSSAPARPAVPSARPQAPARSIPPPARSTAPAPPRPAQPSAPAPGRAASGPPTETSASLPSSQPVPADRLKEAFLEEVRKVKKFFYGTVIAQAQRIDIDGDRVVMTFSPQHRAMKAQLEQTRPLLETIATELAGRKMAVVAAEGASTTSAEPQQAEPGSEKKAALREQALADSGVQAMLDVFAAEIRDVEEM
jgi:DNA polymerase-3 subunit gamma/tau